MMPICRCLPSILALPLATMPALACPQDNSRDAAAYPCGQPDRLVVRQEGTGFAIARQQRDAEQVSPPPTTVAPIAIGALHRIDRSILLSQAPHTPEATHAAR